MFIEQLIGQTGVPVLEQLMGFAAARHELLVHNIANIDTPGYRAQDLSVQDFQQAMARAIDRRGRSAGRLVLRGEQVRTGPDGRLTFRPAAADDREPLFHDQATRQVEKEMSALAQNTLTFNLAAELLRRQFESLKTAIRQRL